MQLIKKITMTYFPKTKSAQYPSNDQNPIVNAPSHRKKQCIRNEYTCHMPPLHPEQSKVEDRLHALHSKITSSQDNQGSQFSKVRKFEKTDAPFSAQFSPVFPQPPRLDTNVTEDVNHSTQNSCITPHLRSITEMLDKEFQPPQRKVTLSFQDKPASSSTAKSLEDLNRIVKEFSHAQNWPKALETIDEIIRNYPNNISAFVFSCNFLMRHKHYEKILSAAEKFSEHSLSSLIPLMYSSLALRHLGRWKESVEKAKTLLYNTTFPLLLNPKDVDTLTLKSKALFLLGDFEESLNCANEVLSIDSTHFFALKCKMEALQSLGRWEESLKTAKDALVIYPFDIEILDLKAKNLHLLGKWKKLLKTADKLLNDNNSNVEALKYRATALLNLGEFALSLNASEDALMLNPDDAEASFIKADALDKLGQHTESNKIYHAILK